MFVRQYLVSQHANDTVTATPMSFDDLLLSYRDYYGTYHHHKEQMAYGATVLYLSVASALILKGPAIFGNSGPSVLEVKFLLLTIILGFLFVGWQLRNRETAADLILACTMLAARRLADALQSPDVQHREWKGLELPGALVDVLGDIAKRRGLLGGPRISEALTYLAMTAWTVAAGARLAS